MERLRSRLQVVFLASLLFLIIGGSACAAIDQNRGVDERLISSWLGVVEGEVHTRTLTITGLRSGPNTTILANAGYGMTDGDILPVRCEIIVGSDASVRLSMRDFHGDQIDAVEVADGWFVGTYTYKNGRQTSITLGRIWDEDLPKNRFTLTASDSITLVYFGAEDCPESAAWEHHGQEMFLYSTEREYIDFRVIKRPIQKRSPVIDDFPDDLKWIYEDAEAGGVSPYFVVAVDRNVVLRTYGLGNWDRKVLPLLKELCRRKALALARPPLD